MSFSERGEALLAKLRQERLLANNQKPVFGPPPSKAIFQRKWCDKLNARLNKLPRKNIESNMPFYPEALDLGIAFQAEALSLGYTFKDFREEAGLDTSRIKNLSENINCSSPFYACSILKLLINSTAKLWADEEMDVWGHCEGTEKQKQAAREQAEDFLVKLYEADEAGVWDARLAKDDEEMFEAMGQKFKPAQRRAGSPKWW